VCERKRPPFDVLENDVGRYKSNLMGKFFTVRGVEEVHLLLRGLHQCHISLSLSLSLSNKSKSKSVEKKQKEDKVNRRKGFSECHQEHESKNSKNLLSVKVGRVSV